MLPITVELQQIESKLATDAFYKRGYLRLHIAKVQSYTKIEIFHNCKYSAV
jgi:hypothetical protein